MGQRLDGGPFSNEFTSPEWECDTWQAAQDNHFMHSSTAGTSGQAGGSVTHKALQEFAGLHHELTEVRLLVAPPTLRSVGVVQLPC